MKIRSPLFAKLAAVVIVVTMRLLFRTCRTVMVADDPRINAYEPPGDERFLFAVWHDQIIMTLFSGRPQQMAGLVSRHQDGSYVSETMELSGIKPIRGSSKRGGSQAMRQMIETAADYHIAITPDGPRGPRHVLKDGIVFLASHSGRAAVASAYSCRRCWRIGGSWTDMMLPKPFTTIYVRAGTPIRVPANASREQLEVIRSQVQAEMERLEVEVDELAGGVRSSEPVRRAA